MEMAAIERKILSAVLAVCIVTSSCSVVMVERLLGEQDRGDNSLLNHMVVDQDTNMVYVGAVNKLYHLDRNLSTITMVETGPQLDSIKCVPPGGEYECSYDQELTHNHNKVLLIYNSGMKDKLITCGSVYQGACEVRNLFNISRSNSHYSGDKVPDFAVAANSPEASTVAFIAPGPPDRTQAVLYVATTYTGTNDDVVKSIRDKVPAISSRSLRRNRFALAQAPEPPQDRSSAIYVKNEVRSQYGVHYVTGFSSGNYSYFLTVQPKSLADPQKVSKIIHICQKDLFFYSYADVPVKCTVGDEDYNILQAARTIHPGENLRTNLPLDAPDEEILVGVFSREDALNGNKSSAICVYTMPQVRQQILQNIKKCYHGDNSVSGGEYLTKGRCNRANAVFPDGKYLCNTGFQVYSNIVGTIPLVAEPVLTYPDTWLTSVALTTSTKFTIAFVGTSEGQVKKILLESSTEGREYGGVTLDRGSAINQDMMLDSTGEHLYAMSRHKISKVRVENCEHHSSCINCLSTGDPYCGWCALENRCTLRSKCSAPTSDRWLFGQSEAKEQCIVIKEVSPSLASVTKVEKLYLTVKTLPTDSEYSCVFTELNWSSPAVRWGYGVFCYTPNFTQLGVELGSKGHKVITLALNSSETGILFTTYDITFYNCSSFTGCTDCTNNKWSCDWCVYENQCMYNSSFCQPDVILSKNRFILQRPSLKNSGSGRRGSLHCPKVDATKTGTIYLPDNIERTVIIKGYNFPLLKQGQMGYRCLINAGQKRVEAVGTLLDSGNIRCDIPAVQYDASAGFYNAPVSVVWGNNIHVEDSEGLHVTIYKCNVLAAGECGICRNLNYTQPLLQCHWCDGNCKYTTFCNSQVALSCPAPEISRVTPLTGHVRGGTLVTIYGRNLGSKFEDIQNLVTIAGISCKPVRELYKPSRKIECKTGRSIRGPLSGPVMVSLQDDIEYPQMFHYQAPKIQRIHPSMGPIAGGSLVTVYGENLDTGNNISASIGRKPCRVVSDPMDEGKIVCRTSAVRSPIEFHRLHMNFDEQEEVVSLRFRYIEDPTIKKISPLESFASGGRKLTITGTNFHSIQTPQMFARYRVENGETGITDMTVCSVQNSTTMFCLTPAIAKTLIHRRTQRVRKAAHFTAELAFHMDSVESVRNLTAYFPQVDRELRYYPDPVLYNFTEKNRIKKFKGEVLILDGCDITLAAKEDDIRVMIGRKYCNVTNVVSDQIFCTPPKTQPSGVDRDGFERDDKLPVVTVIVGNLRYQVGEMEYDRLAKLTFPIEVIAGIAAGGGFLVLIIVLILIIYRRQNTKSERIYRKMQIQLDNLESNVRNECKQAFAELQTDMTDLTGDLVSSGIPFWDYYTYTFKVLFPGMADHVILHPPFHKNGSLKYSDNGLQLFYHLLNNKCFLLTFIHSLENQRSFSIRDKVNVASLLMIVYQDNMEYATEILKALLNELVDRSVAGRHPKLMLRRTESVVEKLLTNWLSLCLYRYLKDSAGSSLFVLYKAVKLQVEKGPIDYITGDARYSLSEDRLLREKIEPKVMTLNVEHEGETCQCRVLDCDTITQAKEKMLDLLYRNTPFCQRPYVMDLDLEWRKGPVGIVTIQDEDNTTQRVDSWKQINTLSHYKVYDGASFVLYRRHQTLKSPNGSLDTSGFSQMSYYSGTPIVRTESDAATKFWHLVKHHDDNQVNKDGGVKMISEIFLTRLLATKGTLQKYIDDFFATILTASPSMPPVIKYLFDLLDDVAYRNGITEPDIIHTWKCNSLPLRFWVNIIKNPDFVFDIHKPPVVDSCLSVVAQTFMDSCSTSEHRLGKDSPSNKLLFAKDIPAHRKMVEKYFKDIQELPSVSDQDMNSYLAEVSRMNTGKFYKSSALRELYTYISKYSQEVMCSLEEDITCCRQQLPAKLGQVITSMEGPTSKIAYV